MSSIRTEPHLDMTSSAVLVIDVQNDFCHPEGMRAKSGCDVTAVTAMVPRLQRFIAACRQRQATVVFVHTTHDKFTDSEAWIARRPPAVSSDRSNSGRWNLGFLKH